MMDIKLMTRHVTSTSQVSEKVYYMRQYVGNACGTVGILHALVKPFFYLI